MRDQKYQFLGVVLSPGFPASAWAQSPLHNSLLTTNGDFGVRHPHSYSALHPAKPSFLNALGQTDIFLERSALPNLDNDGLTGGQSQLGGPPVPFQAVAQTRNHSHYRYENHVQYT